MNRTITVQIVCAVGEHVCNNKVTHHRLCMLLAAFQFCDHKVTCKESLACCWQLHRPAARVTLACCQGFMRLIGRVQVSCSYNGVCLADLAATGGFASQATVQTGPTITLVTGAAFSGVVSVRQASRQPA